MPGNYLILRKAVHDFLSATEKRGGVYVDWNTFEALRSVYDGDTDENSVVRDVEADRSWYAWFQRWKKKQEKTDG